MAPPTQRSAAKKRKHVSISTADKLNIVRRLEKAEKVVKLSGAAK